LADEDALAEGCVTAVGASGWFAPDVEAAAAAAPPSLADPVSVGWLFLDALTDPLTKRDALELLVTPESREMWGDFAEAAATLMHMEAWGASSIAVQAMNAPDVRYVKVIAGVTQQHQLVCDSSAIYSVVLTLVWRPEHGRWMVHAFSADYISPEHVPRTA
jgi:hypothetical protein